MTNCPKCGHPNPKDTIFCEECDWRLDQAVTKAKREKTGKDATMFSAIALILGLVSAVTYFAGIGAVAIVAGIIGMVGGGYAINLPRYIECNKGLCTAMAGIGILTSIIGFIFGLTAL